MAKDSAAMPMDNYQAQSDARTMIEHHAIKSDKKRHAAALAHMKTQAAAMQAAMGEGKDTKAHERAEGPGKETAEKKAGQG
jgi:hypothetical protein